MNRNLKKYFISLLSLLLILSNFSFATSYLYCTMKSEVVQTCCCTHTPQHSDGTLSLSQFHKSCCDSRTSEISNSNILNTVKSETNHNNLSVITLLGNDDVNVCFADTRCVSLIATLLHHQIPKTDIPISNSSLLI